MKINLLCLIILCLVNTQGWAQNSTSPLWGTLKPGKYEVGFQTQWFVDESRVYQQEDQLSLASKGRPFRLMVWYPAKANYNQIKLTFGDYLNLQASEQRFAAWAELMRQKDLGTAQRQFAEEEFRDSLLNIISAMPTMATLNAAYFDDQFPLIIHSLGLNNYQEESTAMWEYLASNGFVVVVLPQIGAHIDQIRSDFSIQTIQRESMDIGVSIKFLRKSNLGKIIDFEKIGLLGHSLGGAVALHYAQKNRIKGLALLDGAISDEDSERVWKGLNLDFSAMHSQILNLFPIYKKDILESPVLKAIPGEQYPISYEKATHFDFQQWPIYSQLTGVEDPRGAAYRTVEIGVNNYLTTCQMVYHFFNYSLKGKKKSKAILNGELAISESQECGLKFW